MAPYAMHSPFRVIQGYHSDHFHKFGQMSLIVTWSDISIVKRYDSLDTKIILFDKKELHKIPFHVHRGQLPI
jgi:hypothetical protein